MPIEFWWWIEPLFLTGFVVMIVCTVILCILAIFADRRGTDILIMIITAITFIPLVVSCGGAIVWFLVNVFTMIWKG